MTDVSNNNVDISFYKKLCQASPNGVIVYDSDFKCISMNPSACDIFDLKLDDVLNKNFKDFFLEDKNYERYEKYKETLLTGESSQIFYSRMRHNIEQFLCVNAVKVEDQLALFISDITSSEEVNKEYKLKEADKAIELQSLLFGIPSPVFFKDSKSIFTSVNKACADFYNVSIEDMVGKSIADFTSLEEAEIALQADKDILSGRKDISSSEHLCFDAKGILHWFLTTIVAVKKDDGKNIGIVGISFDITERKITETELDLLATALHQTSETVVITDIDGKIQYVNPAFERTSGYLTDEVLGKTPAILKSGEQNDEFYKEMWNTIKKGQSWSGNLINKKKDGSLFEEESVISPVFSSDGVITNYVAVKRDVTKEVSLEDRLRQSQKMEAIGRLAGGIAHDFNNILTAILGYSELILSTITESDALYQKVFEIRKAGLRASELTKQMLAFSRKQVLEQKVLNLNKVINDISDMLKRLIGEDVKFKLFLDENINYIMSDAGQITQVIMNLTVNAKDALPEMGGEITITTENIFLKEDRIDNNFSVPPGPYTVIKVKDNGCGIPKDSIKHIFEPFFSQKIETVGTGLGLSTVYGIVKQHNGCIKVDSEEGVGTVFEILLPSAPITCVVANEETSYGKDFVDGVGVVFIVEDELPVLELAESILQVAGYSVITANSAENALEILNNDFIDIDLLVTDLVLPGISGDKLADELRLLYPSLKVLFMSGYSEKTLPSACIDVPGNDFIEKPFSMEKLSSKVHGMLNIDR